MRPLNALAATAAAVVLAGAAAGCSSAGSGDRAPSSPPATTSAASPTPTTAKAPQDAYARVQQWYAGVQAHVAAIQTSTEAIRTAALNKNVSALPPLCAALHNSVLRVLGDPLPPDKLMAAAFSTSMASYNDAATSCLAGDYNATAAGINTGAQYLSQANNIMNNLG